MSDPNNLPVRGSREDTQDPVAKGTDDPQATAGGIPGAVVESKEPTPPDVHEGHSEQIEKPPAQTAANVNEPTAVQVGSAPPADPADAGDLLTQRIAEREAANTAVLAASRQHTRRAFALGAVAVAAGYGFYRWIDGSPGVEMQPQPLRQLLQANAAIARALTREHPLAPTYSLKEAGDLRVNGIYGLKKALVSESWRLQLVGLKDATRSPRFSPDVTAWEYRYEEGKTHEDQGHDTKVDPNAHSSEKMAPEAMLSLARLQEERVNRMPRGTEEAGMSHSTLKPQTPGLLLSMQDLLMLPRHELVTQFKCIEGWSEIVHWAGVRLADLLDAYPPEAIDGSDPKFVYMETPDGDYYTGYDLDACRHPQALLVTEMMGVPLTQFHGAPLRLHMPTKYGYKQIKRIGLISYTNSKPDDYWTKLGYDWYAGL